jgi:hypothetical protein
MKRASYGKPKLLTQVDLARIQNCDVEDIKKVLRSRRVNYLNAYQTTINNHITAARETDVLSAEEYAEVVAWFNELRDVTDTLDVTVFERVPEKVKKHLAR